MALIDSGAAGNFIHVEFTKSHNIPLVTCESHLAVVALDRHPLGTSQVQFTTRDPSLCTGAIHTETFLFVFQSLQTPIILGLPWLEIHNPHISWTDKQITQWSDSCLQRCLHIPPQRTPTKLRQSQRLLMLTTYLILHEARTAQCI